MERCKQHLVTKNAAFLIERIQVFNESSATVELAAVRLNCEPARIAKSLSFSQRKVICKAEAKAHEKAKMKLSKQQQQQQDGSGAGGSKSVGTLPADLPTTAPDDANVIVIVAAGDAKVSAKKYKEKFACQPKMLKREEVEPYTGFPPGAVCPFGLHDAVKVYLDVSLRRFSYVYPAAGTANTSIKVTLDELEQYASNAIEWADLCEGWQPEVGVAASRAEDTCDGSGTAPHEVQNAGIAAKKAQNEASKSAEATA
nr:hypothetical protein, conserved [Leishmania guyanensis]